MGLNTVYSATALPVIIIFTAFVDVDCECTGRRTINNAQVLEVHWEPVYM